MLTYNPHLYNLLGKCQKSLTSACNLQCELLISEHHPANIVLLSPIQYCRMGQTDPHMFKSPKTTAVYNRLVISLVLTGIGFFLAFKIHYFHPFTQWNAVCPHDNKNIFILFLHPITCLSLLQDRNYNLGALHLHIIYSTPPPPV